MKLKIRESENKSAETYGLEFVTSNETLDAMKEADDILTGKKDVKGYRSFNEMLDDLIVY